MLVLNREYSFKCKGPSVFRENNIMTHFCCMIIYVVSQSNKLFLRLNLIRQKFYKGRGWLQRSGGRRSSCSRSSNMFILISRSARTHTHTHTHTSPSFEFVSREAVQSLRHSHAVSRSRGRRYLLHTSSVPFWSTFIASLDTIFFLSGCKIFGH